MIKEMMSLEAKLYPHLSRNKKRVKFYEHRTIPTLNYTFIRGF